MLVNAQGKIVQADKLPKGGRAREAALATHREYLVVQPTKGHGFSIEARARLVSA